MASPKEYAQRSGGSGRDSGSSGLARPLSVLQTCGLAYLNACVKGTTTKLDGYRVAQGTKPSSRLSSSPALLIYGELTYYFSHGCH
jgi:hypothetical protein